MQYSEELGEIEGVSLILLADSVNGFIIKDTITIQDETEDSYIFNFYPF